MSLVFDMVTTEHVENNMPWREGTYPRIDMVAPIRIIPMVNDSGQYAPKWSDHVLALNIKMGKHSTHVTTNTYLRKKREVVAYIGKNLGVVKRGEEYFVQPFLPKSKNATPVHLSDCSNMNPCSQLSWAISAWVLLELETDGILGE